MQLRQDISSAIGNLQRIVQKHRSDVTEAREAWQDARANHFFETELPAVEDGVKRLIVYLQKNLEFAESVAQQTRDEVVED